MGICSKTLHKHYIYENCEIYFFEIHHFLRARHTQRYS